MATAFLFINSASGKVDEASRRSSRRHVMKGKNAGKTLNRTSRLDLAKREVVTTDQYRRILAPDVYRGAQCNGVLASKMGAPQSLLNNASNDSYFSFAFPIRVTKTELDIMNQWMDHIMTKIYPKRLDLALEDTKLSWLQVLCADEATCRCYFALMQAGNEIFLGDVGDPKKAAYSMSRTLREVQNRLQSDKALDDSTIAIILSLIMQEQIRGDYLSAKVHMEGLGKIIKLRGGVEKIGVNPVLALKIGMTDIVACLQSGNAPLFFRDNMVDVRTALASNAIDFDLPPHHLLSPLRSIDMELQNVWSDCMRASRLFRRMAGCQLNVWTFQEIELSICYRLLWYRPLGSEAEISTTSTACYIGLINFICTMFLQYDNRRMINFPLVSSHARTLLIGHIDSLNPNLAFWLAAIVSIWVSSDPDGSWVIPVLRQTADRLDVITFDQALKHLTRFPWVSPIHDPPVRMIWSSVREEHTTNT